MQHTFHGTCRDLHTIRRILAGWLLRQRVQLGVLHRLTNVSWLPAKRLFCLSCLIRLILLILYLLTLLLVLSLSLGWLVIFQLYELLLVAISCFLAIFPLRVDFGAIRARSILRRKGFSVLDIASLDGGIASIVHFVDLSVGLLALITVMQGILLGVLLADRKIAVHGLNQIVLLCRCLFLNTFARGRALSCI